MIDTLIRLEADFWEHVQSNVPPPLDGSDASARFLSERFPESVPFSMIDLPLDADVLIRQYDDASEKVRQYTKQMQEAENLLKQMLGDNEAGIAGERLITWKSVTQERLDSKTLKAEHPTLYQKYTAKSSFRRFVIKAVS